MATATWNGTVIARSDQTVKVDGNQYFPMESVDQTLLRPVDKTTVCSWKGTANYFSVVVDGEENTAAAWVYRTPKQAASEIEGKVAFWRGVTVTDD